MFRRHKGLTVFGLVLLLLELLLPVATPVPASAQELLTHEEYYPSGQIMLRYTYYLHHDYPVLHGLWTEWYENGQMSLQEENQHGDLLWRKEWYENGQEKAYYEYKDFLLHGKYTEWYENGQMSVEGQYEDGKEQGTWSHWYETGQMQRQSEFRDGVLHGLYTEWDENGQIMSQGQYEDGKKHGTWTEWVEFGAKLETEWVQGTLYTSKAWYEDGTSEQREYGYKGGELESYSLTKWDKSERKRLYAEYNKDDKEHGAWIEWYENGQMSVEGKYEDGKEQGAWIEWYENGQMSVEGKYEDGKEQGTWIEWNENGQMVAQGSYKNGRKQGTWTQWDSSGEVIAQYQYVNGQLHGRSWWIVQGFTDVDDVKHQQEYFVGIRHGQYVRWGWAKEGRGSFLPGEGRVEDTWLAWRIVEIGQYSNDKPYGIWYHWGAITDWTDWSNYYSKWHFALETQTDHGPAEPLIIKEEPERKGIRGSINDAKSGEPIAGAGVKAGGFETYSNDSGFYSLTLGEEDSYTLTISKDGYRSYSDTLNMAGYQYKTVNIKLKRDPTNRPAITNVKSKYGHVFLQGVPVENEYAVSVDWQGEPGTVTFDVNGKVYQVPGTATGAKRTFNMGSEFQASSSPLGNSLKITAVNKANIASETVILNPVVLPIPEWAQGLGSFVAKPGVVLTYTLEGNWPEEPVEIQINQEGMGPTLWTAWGFFPLIGGREFGIPNTQVFLKSEFKSTGEGSVALGGKTGFEAAGAEIGGKLGGKGSIKYKPDVGLLWEGADLLFGFEGTIKKEVGPVTLIPALEGAVGLPVVGKVIGWFNNQAKIVGAVKVEAELPLQIISEKGELGFQKAQLEIKVGQSLGLALNLSEKVKAEVSGGGTDVLVLQVPADPTYIKGFTAELWAKLAIRAWIYTREFEAKHSWPTEAKANPGLAAATSDFKPVSRDFIKQNPHPYSDFVANAMEGLLALSPGEGATEKEIMANVYPYSEPAIAENKGQVAIAFVYFDPDDPTTQATEIYFVYYDGLNYRDVGLVRDDTRAEFAPTIAFDQEGKVVAVWERVKKENLTEESILEMAKAMEIVYAVYDPLTDSWSEVSSLSDNDFIDHSPRLRRGGEGKLLVIWQSNEGNELIGDADSPSRIHYAIWDGVRFGNIGALPQEFANSFQFSLAYYGEKAILSYVKDMDGDLATVEDEEIFYTSFDGSTWSDSYRVTNDQQADVNPQVVYRNDGAPELVWLKGDTLVRLTDWNTGKYEIVRERSRSAAFTDFKIAADPKNRLVLLWQDIDERGTDLFYSVYNPDSNAWSNDLRLTEDSEMETDFHGGFSADGTFHLVYNKQNLETQANGLYYLTHKLFTDLAVSPQDMSVEPENPSPGTQVTLVSKVENKGDLAVEDVSVAFYLGDPKASGILIGTASVEPAVLKAQEKGRASLLWTIPENLDVYTVYAVVDPENTLPESNESNNSAHFDAVKPDLEALHIRLEEHGDGSVDVIAIIQNSGFLPATDVEVLYKTVGKDFGIIKVPGILSGKKVEVAHTLWPGIDVTWPEIEVQVDPQDKIVESSEDNNRATALLDIAPRISVFPTSHSSGDVKVGRSSTPRTFTISNTGSADLEVRALSFTGTNTSEFSITNDNSSGRTLGPSESGTLDVVFSPTSEGAKRANLTISSNDPATPLLDIPVEGVGVMLHGDVNGDDKVDINDLVAVALAFNSEPPANPAADLNGDGIVDLFDLVEVGRHFGQALTPG